MSTFFRSIILLIFVSFTQLTYNQAPNWIWNSPMAVIPSSVSGAGLSVYVMVDRPAYINYVVLAHGSPAPTTAAQIEAGTDGLGNAALWYDNPAITTVDYKSGYYSIEITNPSPTITTGTEYDLYFVASELCN